MGVKYVVSHSDTVAGAYVFPGNVRRTDENLAPNVSGGGFSFGNMAAQLAAAAAAQPLLSE